MIYRMKLADSVDEMTFDLLEVPIEDKDIEGATDNTTIDGNIFTDYLWLKKQFVQKWSLMCKDDYTQLRGFYTRQWENAEAPTYTLFAGQNRSETLTASGSAFRIQNGTQYDAPLTLTELKGNATQNGTPTPTAPVAVNTTTGENVVKIMRKNLFDKNNYSSTAGFFHTRDTLIATGSATHNILFWIPCATNTKYSITTPTGYGIITKVATSEVVPANGVAVSGSQRYETTTINGYTTGATAKYLVVYLQAQNYTISDILSNITANLMIELGSTATDYEPYQGQVKTVNLGKNLLQPMTGLTNQGLTGTVNSDGTITVSGTATNNYSFITDTATQNIPAGTYMFGDGLVGQTYRCIARFTYTDNTYVECDLRNQGAGRTFTLTQTATNCQIRLVNITSGTTYNLTIKPQVEKGTTATTYAPYFTPIELAKIGTYQDRIYKDDGKWYIEKQVGKVVLNGSEPWSYQSYGYFFINYDTSFDLGTVAWSGEVASEALCDHFVCRTRYFVVDSTWGHDLSIGSSTGQLDIKYNALTTADALKSWLASHPTTVYYALATPTTTEITDSTLLSQLNFIANLYGGTNNIMLVGTGAQGEIGVEYTLTYEKEQTIIPETTVRLTLTDGGVINTCECRQNVQLTMRETVQ